MARQKNKFQKGEPEFHFRAFLEMALWQAKQPEYIRAFEKASGLKVPFAKTPLDAMIDKATGRDRECAERFIKWCAELYGLRWLPDDYLERMLKPKEKTHV